jgi:D-3-phosphoglycerate dehydrogenase
LAFKVFIPQDIVPEGKRFLIDRGYVIKIATGVTVDQLSKEVRDCDAILVRTALVPRQVLEAGSNVRVIARHGVGVDNIDVKAATELGIWVTFAPESNSTSVAEYTLGMLIALARNLTLSDRAVRTGEWEFRNKAAAYDLAGKTLGLVGVGRVGALVARKARQGLDMEVLAYDPYVKEVGRTPEVRFVDDLGQLFKTADFISLHIPATPETKGLVDKKYMRMMKPTAFLVNTARGEVVNEVDLFDALKSGQIAGAGLDVFNPEPPRKDSPLFGLDNVILTPHNAALTKECMERMAVHAAMGIDDVLSGRRPKWPVNEPRNPRK